MDDATVGMVASKKEAASIHSDAVAVANVDDVAGVNAEAVPTRSGGAFPIQNNPGYSWRLYVQDPVKICWCSLGSPKLPQGTTEGFTCYTITCKVEGQLKR